MSGALKKTMIYLGLADEEEQKPSREVPESPAMSAQAEPEKVHDFTAKDSAAVDDLAPVEEFRAPVAHLRRESVAREESTMHQITTVHPRSYNDAKVIGEAFRNGIPVIMNVTEMGDTEAKRLVDFSAGLTFGLNGSIERVTKQVFLLTPENIEVLGEDQKASENQEHFFNQS